ncbi:hypothetical protein FOPG_08250 [Fusarium oxysporum f. sp. conglutinans race 2 54008]|uniref:BZIP domain-containing protein n=4 Tax=Fusarium oxysporum f. sp. conglutinans TaxID=100902 RepID=A0A8H6H3I1_FUSOX|nr:hypothetical protein FOXB_13482 [Fusarium oxysporum f. sp. conglutinans Fo5176]EXL77215.1 hypothetical protein FOPG_08250 [Fusarium oxysporum f. sp. conglutinans race 2 54008]KAF6529617.1 hypothetical protein HZS61_000929 [Fusarium oxysporum f. sp. conglutinans]KAI8418576.1 hypothetical protein FOFC_01145 [Fusarium oxysporum]EXL77216.1 hypothetical protein FOPG_08250 [Fusarium oxysporum f. sp. conglutinans race 2 54008]
MTSTFQMQQPFYRPASLTVDTQHAQKYFEDEDNSVLDDNILEHNTIDSGLELSPPMADSRRESFAVGPPLFSPKQEDWQSVEMQSVSSNNPFFDQHSNNPFMRPDHTQNNGFAATANWFGNTSGTCTPLNPFDGVPAEYDANASLFHRPMAGPTPFTNPGNMFPSLPVGSQSIPTSPQKEWMTPQQPINKNKMRPSSPGLRSHNEMRRGDGIRKKNARFDIPAERNLSNIDHLISQSTDEQEIKELKQQKRLLRNRQAALDSRQRKKQHTERLEDEKKQYTALMTNMEEELKMLHARVEQLALEKQECIKFIETQRLDKEEMIRVHTNETGELRKKISVLTDHVQRLDSAVPATGDNGFSNGFDAMDAMDGLGMPGAWDASNFLHDYPEPEVKQEMAIVPAKKNDNPFAESEKPAAQGGLLFMLFLVGAFVLSSRSTPAIPRVSEDVRAASATILDNVLKDAGVNSQSASLQAAPQPSGAANWGNTISMNDMAMDGVAPSMLGELGDQLAQPTQEQTNEQIFSLSAAQYNGVNSQDFLQNAPERSSPSQGRRNLAEALATMRIPNKQNDAAEVYTRSLLWDQIPNDVVRNFAKMVSECNSAQNEQQCNELRT